MPVRSVPAMRIPSSNLDRKKVAKDFAAVVNMGPEELAEWLRSPMSKAVGWKGTDGEARESIGHASGRRIVTILRTASTDLSEEDYNHMRKVVGYVRRHLAQEPANVVTSRWRYSLMNWGHDPLKNI